MKSTDNLLVKANSESKFLENVNYTDRTVKCEVLEKIRETESENLRNHYKNKKEKEIEIKCSHSYYRDEDLQNILIYYMKLTIELRKRNLERDRISISDRDIKNNYYSISTDYDSEEPTSRKSSFRPLILKCQHCSKLLRGFHSLKNHCMRKHGNHSEKNVLCDKCPTRFYTDFEFNRHYQTHYSVKNYLCHLCSKKFFQKSSLELHLRYHRNDRRYQCEICRKKFFTNNHLKRHCLTHSNRKDFRCEPCNRSFRYKDHLRRHLQSVHIGIRSHYCRECNKPFMYLSQLKFHEQSHKEVPIKCSNCKKNFKKRISLKLHQRICKE